jgi:spatzle-processing enzyme
VQEKHSSTIRKAEEATFYFGKHNLESLSEKYYIISAVKQFIIHSDWNVNDDKYDADLAVAVLQRTIPFSKFVKPICLPTSSVALTSGIVAGWGKTEHDAISTATPRWAEIPVVDLLTCIRSNDAFNKLTSDRTFCAGNRRGDTGPCSGENETMHQSCY